MNNNNDKNNQAIINVEKEIRKGETIKIQAETRIGSLREQYLKIDDALKELGINPKDAEADIAKLEKEEAEKTKRLLELVPSDVIKKYENYNFNALPEGDKPNIGKIPF